MTEHAHTRREGAHSDTDKSLRRLIQSEDSREVTLQELCTGKVLKGNSELPRKKRAL